MKNTEKAYIAGIIDGEGTISMTMGKQRSPKGEGVFEAIKKTVRVCNTNLGLIEWLHEKVGAGYVSLLYQNPNSKYDRFRKGNVKPLYAWSIHGRDIPILLKLVKPYLLIKKELASLALESTYWSWHRGDGSKYAPGVLQKQREICAKMHQLNKRGI